LMPGGLVQVVLFRLASRARVALRAQLSQPQLSQHLVDLLGDVAGSGEVVERRLRDGTRHRLIKVVRDPADLTRQLTELGWQAAITWSGDWLAGQTTAESSGRNGWLTHSRCGAPLRS
jgi:hypothetical protein